MKKLSALIFCRDDAEKAVGLVRDIVGICDQIVLIDSSNRRNFARLSKAIRSLHTARIDLYHTLALGYPDPMRAYGLGKCRHDWILYIDTDERINSALKRDIKKIASDAACDGFAIKRYERANLNGETGSFFTWQIRLYNKRKTYYRGLLHEQPVVNGALKKLDEKYFMLHVDELKTEGSKRRDLEYSLIKKYYDRMTYKMLNSRMKEYLGKLFLTEDKRIEDTLIGKVVLGWMRFYQVLTFRKLHKELSTFDYFVFFSMIEGAYVIKRKDIKYLFGEAIPTVLNDTRNASEFKMDSKSSEIFEISKAVNRYGIIRYLMLDKDKVVESLYRKYKNSRQGIGLLMKLLEDRYNNNYP